MIPSSRRQNCHDSGPGTPNHEDTTTFQFFSASPAWQDRFDRIKLAAKLQAKRTSDANEGARIFPDLNPYIPNVIMVDGLEEDESGMVKGFSTIQLDSLRLMILSHLMASLPCMAIGTLRHGDKDGWKDSASLVQSNIPVLYLDVRQRPAIVTDPGLTADRLFQEAKKSLDEDWEAIARSGRLDVLDVCRMAFWHSVCQAMMSKLLSDGPRPSTDNLLSICDAIDQAKKTSRVMEDSTLPV